MDKKSIKALVEKIDGKMFAIASDDTLDRHGDSIGQDTWDLKNFKKNPVLLLSHQYHLPPIGIAKNIKIQDGKLVFEPIFHTITQAAKEVGEMFEKGFMNAFSVGFMPKGDGSKGKYLNELLEISAVSVPANPNALILERSIEQKGEVDEWLKKEIVEKEEVKEENDVMEEITKQFKEINIRLENIEKGRPSKKQDDILLQSLEKLNKSLGYLNRKVK